MLPGFDISVEMLKMHMRDPVPPVYVNIRHHQDKDSLFKVRGALRIPERELEQRLDEIPHDRPVVVYSTCPGDEASRRAAHILRQHGWDDVHPLVGGFNAYLRAGLPVEGAEKDVPATKIMLL